MRILAILCLVVSNLAYADAPSLLGLCHPQFNCTNVKKLYDGQETIIAGWLENTFGESCKCADALLSDPRPKVIRVHLVNGPCMRNKRCGKYEVFSGYTAAGASREFGRGKGRAVRRFQKVLARAKQRIEAAKGEVKCFVSPCLECDLDDKARRNMLRLVHDALPSCYLVDNPLRQRCIKGTICEKHGEHIKVQAPCIADLDGTNGATIDIQKWANSVKHCELSYYWEPWMNCIRGEFIDPRKRSCKHPRSVFKFTKETICRYFYQSSDTCSR